MDFRKKLPFKSYGVKKPIANEYLLTYGAAAATVRLNIQRRSLLWFFQSLAVGYMLPGILVRQRATSLLLAVQGLYTAFRILSVTLSLTRGLRTRNSTLARPLPNISAEGLHFSAFHFTRTTLFTTMFTQIIVVCLLKSMCVPSFVLFGCCFNKLQAYLCPYRNVWPEAVYCCFTRTTLFTNS